MDLNGIFGDRLKRLSEALVLGDIADLQSLCQAHTLFQELSAKALENALPDWAAVSNAAAELLQSIVLGEAKSPQSALKAAEAAVSAMQLACENRSLSDVLLPPELNVSLKGAALSQAKTEKPEERKAPEPPKDSAFASSCIANMNAAIASDASLVGDFVSESLEHLESCNANLLEIEAGENNFEAVNAVFRAFHTIKGVASFLNLAEVRNLAHQSESLLDKARSGKIKLSGLSLDLVFEAVDTMKLMIDDLGRGLKSGKVECSAAKYPELIEGLQKLCQIEGAAQKAAPAAAAQPQKSLEEESAPDGTESVALPPEIIAGELPRFLEEMNEHLENADKAMLALEGKSDDQESLNALFRAFHTIKGSSGFLGLSSLERLGHKAESLLGKARDGALKLEGRNADLCFSSIDALKQIAAALKDFGTDGASKLPEFRGLEERLAAACSGEPEPVRRNDKPAEHHEDIPQKLSSTMLMHKSLLRETVKVDAERLDKLVDTIGELVIAETMAVQSPEIKAINSPALVQTLAQLDKITRELQEMGMALRMVPISGTFQKMARLVRDLSKKIGKDIDFAMNGEDTELDKNVVDSIGDPLVHMVRNAVDHGIEKSAEERVKAGKPAKGKVELRAFHKGGSIHIEVADDGRGLDKERILKKAVERGIIQSGDALSDKEIFALIFEPGFSTADKITEVSGRGVGMDVVKRNIEALRGQTEIQSVPGQGSVFSIRLPLTLAIIDGMVVSVAQERYIIPTLSIVMSVRVRNSDFKTVQGRGRMVQLQGQLIPIFDLASLFDIGKGEGQTQAQLDGESLIVVVEDDGVKTGIAIDELLGQQQIVIKSLGDYLKGVPGIAGGAIMPDGAVGLILDVGGLVKLANA